MLTRFADARVLIVDDNATNVAILEGILSHAGLRRTYSATDPRDALTRLDEIDPDLVLLDLHMPGIDGYTILRQLTERAAGAYLPVMVLTADGRPEARERALASGARDFLTKPFDATEVVLRARNLLETRYLHVTMRRHNVALRAELGAYKQLERAEHEARELQRERIERVIAESAIQMAFQPVVDGPTGALVGVEALARFTAEPLQGPDRWFSDAEHVGLGIDLELCAVDAALKALPELPPEVFLAINVSPATVLTAQLTRRLTPNVAPRVVVELTEHHPVEDYEMINAATDRLRRQGARIAADDAGAGYAGFRHLIGLRPDIVKLDICLVRGIDEDPGRRALARALVQFADDTGSKLIAEGIETREELHTLRELGIGWMQGYFLGRPEPLTNALAGRVATGRASSAG